MKYSNQKKMTYKALNRLKKYKNGLIEKCKNTLGVLNNSRQLKCSIHKQDTSLQFLSEKEAFDYKHQAPPQLMKEGDLDSWIKNYAVG